MHTLSARRKLVSLWFVFTLIVLLVGAAFGSGMPAVTQAAPTICDADLLHPKSRAGLMPPACSFDATDGATQLTDAPTLTLLNTPPLLTPVGSWSHVVAAGHFTEDLPQSTLVATSRYFDEPNDQQLHHFQLFSGSTMDRLQQLPGGWEPEAITILDTNHDELQDAVVALAGDDALLLAVQPFTQSTTLPLPGAPNALAHADVNGDLRFDVVTVAPKSDAIHLLQSAPDGLQALPDTLSYPTDGYGTVDAGDMDNDGDDDIVALRGAGYPTDSVMIFFQHHGQFTETLNLSPNLDGFLPHSLAVGDVNNDGRDDLVITAGGNMPRASISVFLQHDDGFETNPVVYPAYHLPSAIRIQDINHDGREDVMVLHDGWRTVSVYLQKADTTLAEYAVVELPYSSYYRPDALTTADLDGNGSLDVAIVDRAHGLMTLTHSDTAPTSTITLPPHASFVSPGPLAVSGTASVDAVTVEVRLRGATEWLPATLNDTAWDIELELPEEYRSWWIEARAIDAEGRYQAPPARHRIATMLPACVPQTLVIAGTGTGGAETSSLQLPADAISTTVQLGGSAYRSPTPETATFRLADGTTVDLTKPTRRIDQAPDVSPFKIGYTFEITAPSGLVEVLVDDPHHTTQALVAYSTMPTDTLYSPVYTTTLQYAWGGNDGHNAVGPATLPLTLTAPLPGVRDVQVQAVVIDKEGHQGSDERIAIVRADAGNGVMVEQIITEPDEPQLNLIDLTLEAVPAGTEVITISLISPINEAGHSQWNNPRAGDSVFLIGGAAQYACAGTLAAPSAPEPQESRQVVERVKASVTRDNSYETIITPEEGGTLDVGRFSITFPAGAVEDKARLVYTASPDLPLHLTSTAPTLRSFALRAYTLNGETIRHFLKPYTIVLEYADTEFISPSTDETRLTLAYWDESTTTWVSVPTEVDTGSNQVTASLDHFTEFVLASSDVQRTPPPRPQPQALHTVYLPAIIR